MTITPRYKDYRYTLDIVEDKPLPRGRWQRTVTVSDNKSNGGFANKKLVIKGASCGLDNCYCDAVMVGIK